MNPNISFNLNLHNVKAPFIELRYDDANNSSTALSFIEAVSEGAFESANRYLSRALRANCELDYPRLKTIFLYGGIKPAALRFGRAPKNIRRFTMLFGGGAAVIHIYTVYEPDSVSNWKICGIDKE